MPSPLNLTVSPGSYFENSDSINQIKILEESKMKKECMRCESTLDLSSQMLCEHYNLDLKRSEEVREFFERHGLIKNMADEVERLKTGGGVELTYELLGSLEFYEYQTDVS